MKLLWGGSGYAIENTDGIECYNKEYDNDLPDEIEHIYPDYNLYPDYQDTAYGFMTRGCPRGCSFCIVGKKEGRKAHTVAPLSEFWNGQKYIELLDPNPIAVPDWKENLQQLKDSKAYVNFSQGLDIRLMTEEKAEAIKNIRIKSIHFAWDRYEDKDIILPKLKMFSDIAGFDDHKQTVYVLTNYNTTTEQDLERIYLIRDLGYHPYVMIYNRSKTTMNDTCRQMQRWCNNMRLFRTCKRFEDYAPYKRII